MQCVLDGLRCEASQRTVAASEWQAALDLAGDQHVLPLLIDRLQRGAAAVPPELGAPMRQAQRECAFHAFRQGAELKLLLRAFAGAGIAVLPLKGPSLARRLYGDAALRISSDLDLLVHREDFAAAVAMLAGLGFHAMARADDYHQAWRRGVTMVEVHFDVENPLAIDFDMEGAWQQARLGEFDGEPAWELAPVDELVYLCLHAARHRFERLSHIVDIAFALQRLPPGEAMALRSRVPSAPALLGLGCAMVQQLYPHAASAAPCAVETRDQPHLQALAGRLWQELLTRPAVRLDWQAQHHFYLELERGHAARLRRRIQHLRILVTRLTETDFAFARRHGVRRPWQVWLLRWVRLARRRRSRAEPEAAQS